MIITENFHNNESKKLLRKYFGAWRRFTRLQNERALCIQQKQAQRAKLENLMKILKNKRKEVKGQQIKPVPKPQESENFKNRYNAQKYMIEKLQIQLDAKNRIIEDLKAGILQDEVLKSMEQTKVDIREIFAGCSEQTRKKVAPPPEFNERFMVSINKAPKIIQEMEERAMKRARNREIIMERKRIIDENRRRAAELAVERQRQQDEEEKQRNLEAIKERQKKELERQRIRQMNKAIFIEKWNKAVEHHENKLRQTYFYNLVKYYRDNQKLYFKAVLYYNRKICSKVFSGFNIIIQRKFQIKYEIADNFLHKKLKQKMFNCWNQARLESKYNFQTAKDFYDFKLTRHIFEAWHDYVCREFYEQCCKMKIAEKHYKMKTLLNYFYLWRTLPAVIQLERAKEEKKKKWREKVWEVLPDYRPPIDD